MSSNSNELHPDGVAASLKALNVLIARMRQENGGRDYYGVPWADQFERVVERTEAALDAERAKTQEHSDSYYCGELHKCSRVVESLQTQLAEARSALKAIAVLSGVAPPPPASPWQPMETAPKDGSAVLVDVRGIVGEARFRADHDKCWHWAGDTHGPILFPGAWMPLPSSKEQVIDA